MPLRAFVLIAFAILILYPQTTRACSCAPLPSKEEQAKMLRGPIDPEARRYWREEFKGAVFVGNVIKIEKVDVSLFGKITRMKKVTVRVERAWVNVTGETFVVYTNLGKGGDCGVPYLKGKSYFFFADIVGGQLETNICSPTDPNNYRAKLFERMFGSGASFLRA